MFNLCLILSLNLVTSSQAKDFQLGGETVDFYSPLPFFEKRFWGGSQGSKRKTEISICNLLRYGTNRAFNTSEDS